MNPFLVILLLAAMIATVVALIRGIVSFLQEATTQAKGGEGPSPAALKSNRMMQQRIFFQALAILIVVLILFAAGRTWPLVKLNRIYTGTGDAGTSGLVDGSRRSKADALFAAIGDVDEANSAIGVALLHLEAEDLRGILSGIQNDLFDLGADLATPLGDAETETALRIAPSQPARLEAEIDAMNTGLAPLRSFVLPGGSAAAAHLHLARAIARRAERAAVAVADPINPQALIYLNRLSDLLFVMARLVNQSRAGDVLWIPGAQRGAT